MLSPFLPASTSLTRLGVPRSGTMSARQPVLLHEMADQNRRARRPARPLALLIGGDQTRLRRKPGDVGRVVRIPEPIDECARGQARRCYRSKSGLHLSHGLRAPDFSMDCRVKPGNDESQYFRGLSPSHP
jgi:hypothetical protein